MSLYTLYCERCDKRTTHEEVWDHQSHPLSVEHDRYDDLEVVCRDCNAGRSKADIPDDGLDATATVKLKIRDFPVHIDPSEIEEDEDIYEYVERLVREEHMEDLVENVTEQTVEAAILEREDGVWPRPD